MYFDDIRIGMTADIPPVVIEKEKMDGELFKKFMTGEEPKAAEETAAGDTAVENAETEEKNN